MRLFSGLRRPSRAATLREPQKLPDPPQFIHYDFTPQPNITAYELAVILANSTVGLGEHPTLGDGIFIKEGADFREIMFGLGIPDAERHFTRSATYI